MTAGREQLPHLILLSAADWEDYELLDSGRGAKLERYGPYRVIRPEAQAMWQAASPEREWNSAHLVFHGDEDAAERGWEIKKAVEPRWKMRYKHLTFWSQPTPFRHLGVFPEQADHWDWIGDRIRSVKREVRVLNLFGYTGIATLAAAAAGAAVTHVDASKKAVAWARDNQALSGLSGKPIRWIVDDALKFVQREERRGAVYDGFILDPPKFGRGPKGELWKLEESLPTLLHHLKGIRSSAPLFVVLTVYALRISATAISSALRDWAGGGTITAGETVLVDRSAQHTLSTSVFARWAADKPVEKTQSQSDIMIS